MAAAADGATAEHRQPSSSPQRKLGNATALDLAHGGAARCVHCTCIALTTSAHLDSTGLPEKMSP